jgi:RHS repeat-associated protein
MPGAAQLLADGGHRYVYGLGQAPLEQIATATGDVDYLHTDLLGSVRTTTNATGAVTSDADYDTYGRTIDAGSALASAVTRFGYAGQYTDPTGYLYLRNRYYEPSTAQFISVDPLLQSTGDPYGYTAGNPLQFTDPLGLTWWKPTTWTASTWDNISIGLTVAAVIVSATGVGAPVGAALFGLSKAANAGSMVGNYQDGNCLAAAMGVLGFIPGGGTVAGKVATHAVEEGVETAAKQAVKHEAGVAAEAEAGSIRAVNPLGGGMNCVNCSVATDATLGGSLASALLSGPKPISVLESLYGGSFKPVSGQAEIEGILADAGNGARGIVYGSRGSEVGTCSMA